MKKVDYVVVGFGGIAENRVAKEGFACDTGRFRPLKRARLVGATDLNQGRRAARIRNIYQEQIERHARSIQEGRPLTGDEAVHNLALCAACHESARQGGKTIVLKQGNAHTVRNKGMHIQ